MSVSELSNSAEERQSEHTARAEMPHRWLSTLRPLTLPVPAARLLTRFMPQRLAVAPMVVRQVLTPSESPPRRVVPPLATPTNRATQCYRPECPAVAAPASGRRNAVATATSGGV